MTILTELGHHHKTIRLTRMLCPYRCVNQKPQNPLENHLYLERLLGARPKNTFKIDLISIALRGRGTLSPRPRRAMETSD